MKPISSKKLKIETHKGDITKLNVDAIVNAANTSLLGGGGVDGAIHRAAGPELLQECRTLNGCKTGEAKITKGYNLPAKFVIHTVGPIWSGGKNNEEELLANCYRNSLMLAIENGITSIAFPAINTGVYHFPLEKATRIAITETNKFLKENDKIDKVIFVAFDEKTYNVYNQLLIS
jgi:O-acetyl-ADP-ribose deacetylase (regulator of RNase III)